MSHRTAQPGRFLTKLAPNSREKSPSQKNPTLGPNFSSFRNPKTTQNFSDSPTDDQLRGEDNLNEITGHFPEGLKRMSPQHFYFDISHLAGESNSQPQPQRTPLQQRDNSPVKPEQSRVPFKYSPIIKGKGIFQQPHRDGEYVRAEYINVSSQILSAGSAKQTSDNSIANFKMKTGNPYENNIQPQNRKKSQKENNQLAPQQAKRQPKQSKSPEHSKSFDRSASQGKKPGKDSGSFYFQKPDSDFEYLSATFRAQLEEHSGQMFDSSRDGKNHQQQQQQSSSIQGEDRPSNIVDQIKNNLQNVTRCKVHNQSFSLFNTLTKQIACIECVYSLHLSKKKQHPYVSLKNAASIISQQNQIYKTEANERIKVLDDNLNVCHASIQLHQQNFDHLLSLINREFQTLHEEMLARRELLVETARSITQNHIDELEGKMQNLEFLNGCFKDARDIDPFQNFELGVHFYAVFNLLRNTLKGYDCQIQKPTPESLNIVEFPNRAETHVLLANYGKVNFQKPLKVGAALKKANFTSSPTKFILTPVKAKKHDQSIKTSTSGSKLSRSPSQTRNNRSQLANEVPTFSDKKTEKKATNLSFDRKMELDPETQKSFHEFMNRTDIQGAYGTETPPRDKIQAQFLSPTQQSSPDGGLIHPELEEHKFENRTPPRNLDGGESTGGEYLPPSSKSEQERTTVGEVTSVAAETGGRYFIKEQEQTPSQSTNRFFQDSTLSLKELDLTEILPPKLRSTQLLYQLSRDGASSAIFHSKVDGHAPVIVFIKANSDYVFGYFTPNAFAKEDKYTTSDKTYLFSLKNPLLKSPMIFPIKTDKKFIAIYQSSKSPCLGSTLHQKQDLWIQFDNLQASCSNVGYAYHLSPTLDGTKVLAGSFTEWQIEEIEAYQVVT